MAFDGCFHDDEIELTPYPGSRSRTMTSDPRESAGVGAHAPGHGGVGVRLHRRKSLRAHVDLLLSHSYMIDSYSRVVFPMSYLLFNVIYWSLYS
ncbi:gamma-aminobutyric acid receptor subunit rho-3-like isoform X3 [Gadus macrocephalus]|nr:gamma-aminobutyric acid receptor subunit rho-3-like isoform X3 [Gadus macrocephalus]